MKKEDMQFRDAYSHVEEIDLKEVTYILSRRWWVIVLVIVLFTLLGYFYTFASFEEVYIADASMVINSKQYEVIDGELVTVNDIYLSQKMVNTYEVVLLSDSVMNLVNDTLETDYDIEEMRLWISVKSPENTEVIVVEVSHPEPAVAVAIANAIMEVAPEVISRTVEVGSINVLDYATLPDVPEEPEPVMTTSIFGIVGLIIGVGGVFTLQFLFPKISSSKEIVSKLKMNIIGEIPRGKARTRKNQISSLKDEDVVYNEAFKMLALRLTHSSQQAKAKKILITSSCEGEGKSTVSYNLALTLAKEGKKVILLECDMHKPSMMKSLGYGETVHGYLKDVIRKKYTFKEYLVKDPAYGLDILFGGLNEKSSYDLFGSLEMKNFLDHLSEIYDFILIDTPPAYVLSDAVTLSKYTDGVLMVIRQEYTEMSVVSETRDSFNKVGANILGAVLNDIRYKTLDSYGKYKYGYSYYNYMGIKTPSPIRRITGWLLFVAWLVVLAVIALNSGDNIVTMAENVVGEIVRIFMPNASQFEFEEAVSNWTVILGNYGQLFLFLLGTLSTIFIVKNGGVKRMQTVLYSGAIMLVVAIVIEILQAQFIAGRGYDLMDIILAVLGILLAYIVWFVKLILFRNRR
jgi:capsular exopolysaccharide synthesis family protein